MSVDLQIQFIAGGIIAMAFFFVSLFWLRARHLGGKPFSTRFGSLIYGGVFATFVIAVMVPMRTQMMEQGPASLQGPEEMLRYIPAFLAFFLIIRSDLTGRLPLIGRFIRAYRGAVLRRTIEGAEKRLEKMAALDERAATGV